MFGKVRTVNDVAPTKLLVGGDAHEGYEREDMSLRQGSVGLVCHRLYSWYTDLVGCRMGTLEVVQTLRGWRRALALGCRVGAHGGVRAMCKFAIVFSQ